MNSISMREFSRVLFPYPPNEGNLIMLMSYFDDSGTDADSVLVISGGLSGVEDQWVKFEPEWKEALANPPSGHASLSRFHAFDCQNALNEYRGWSRTESEYHQNQLVNIVIDAGLYGYGIAISKAAWERHVSKKLQKSLGTAEQFCINSAILFGVGNLRKVSDETQVAIIFDVRTKFIDAHAERVRQIFDYNKRNDSGSAKNLEIVSFTIGNSRKFTQLQGADLVAWLFLQEAKKRAGHCHAQNVLHFTAKLAKTGRMTYQLGDEAEIEAIGKQKLDDGFLEEMGNLMAGNYDALLLNGG